LLFSIHIVASLDKLEADKDLFAKLGHGFELNR
jgi:hypothetical protein